MCIHKAASQELDCLSSYDASSRRILRKAAILSGFAASWKPLSVLCILCISPRSSDNGFAQRSYGVAYAAADKEYILR